MAKDVSDDHHGNLQVFEAFFTDISTFAASPDIVIIVHINIKDHFFVSWHERFFVTCIVSIRRYVIHCTYIDLVWNPADEGLLELFSCLEAKIATVDIVCQSKGKLSVMEILRLDSVLKAHERFLVSLHKFIIANPLEHELVREDPVIINPKPILIKQKLSRSLQLVRFNFGPFLCEVEVRSPNVSLRLVVNFHNPAFFIKIRLIKIPLFLIPE